MIDIHCHLADRKFRDDLDAVLERARLAGVDRMITIGDSLEESERCVQLSEQHPNVFCAVGVHPNHAKKWKEGDWERLRKMAESSMKVRAIGEIGLDYHYNLSPRDDQLRAFEDQLRLARELHLPAVVHNRDSLPDLLAAIGRVAPPALVLHCCTERWEDVEPLVRKGYFLSFTGIATYPSAEDIRETIKACPLDYLMIETDAPYLPPEALRAKGGRAIRNEPAFVIEVAKLIAEIKGLPPEEVYRETTRNAEGFFRLPPVHNGALGGT